MRSRTLRGLLLVGTMLLTGACASGQQWAEWRQHPTHFASGHHLVFSARHREGVPPRVTRADVDASRKESWWGEAVTVSPDQIFQN
jgi:hypothetical protein